MNDVDPEAVDHHLVVDGILKYSCCTFGVLLQGKVQISKIQMAPKTTIGVTDLGCFCSKCNFSRRDALAGKYFQSNADFDECSLLFIELLELVE